MAERRDASSSMPPVSARNRWVSVFAHTDNTASNELLPFLSLFSVTLGAPEHMPTYYHMAKAFANPGHDKNVIIATVTTVISLVLYSIKTHDFVWLADDSTKQAIAALHSRNFSEVIRPSDQCFAGEEEDVRQLLSCLQNNIRQTHSHNQPFGDWTVQPIDKDLDPDREAFICLYTVAAFNDLPIIEQVVKWLSGTDRPRIKCAYNTDTDDAGASDVRGLIRTQEVKPHQISTADSASRPRPD